MRSLNINMKTKITKFISRLLNKPEPIYGAGIFCSRSWLDKQVDEAMRKRSFGLD